MTKQYLPIWLQNMLKTKKDSRSNLCLVTGTVLPSNLQHYASPAHHDIQQPEDKDIKIELPSTVKINI